MSLDTALILASSTEDAYSFGLYYSRREWLKITRFLFEQGYSAAEVEEILRSKHMRWAADHSEKHKSILLADFESYYNFDGYHRSRVEAIREMLDNVQAD